ncbi:MAG: phage capsid protein [Pseudomonadota bacterium]
MSLSIDTAFVKQFEGEVHDAFQRQGSKLRNTVRVRNGVRGSSCVFQRIGKGVASTKPRHERVPQMNADHMAIEVSLNDYYAGDYIDKLDELKVSIDERQALARAGAYALGRQTDNLIIDALDQTTTVVGDPTKPLTKAKVLLALEALGAEDVPDDGERYAVVGWKQWANLLDLPEFASAEYVGDTNLPWQGTQAKSWLGTMWIAHSGLPLDAATNQRGCFWFHKSAVGHAIGQDVTTDISWVGERAAHFVANWMSQGAGLIDPVGCVKFACNEA